LKQHKAKVEKKTVKLIEKVCAYGKNKHGNCAKEVHNHVKKVVKTVKKTQVEVHIVKKVDFPKKELKKKVVVVKQKLAKVIAKKVADKKVEVAHKKVVVVEHKTPIVVEHKTPVVVEHKKAHKAHKKVGKTHHKVVAHEDCDEELATEEKKVSEYVKKYEEAEKKIQELEQKVSHINDNKTIKVLSDAECDENVEIVVFQH